MKCEQDSIDETVVTLDTYNSDLNLVIDASKYSAHPLTKGGFAFMWAGARATHGAAKGRVCFEVKIIEYLDVSHLPADEPNPHVVRVGFSVDSASLQLGEDPLSYGYGGTGKISTNCQFKDFGPPFIAGDCILAVADLESDLAQIGFAKNGNFIGWAYKVKKSEFERKAFFPHVLTKNCSFEVNFGQKQEPYFKLPDPVKDYTFIGCLPLDQRVGGSRPPEKREDCEMIMMCGLPGSGKSVWAADYSLKNPDKKYNILGTNNIIDKMKVMGLPRKRNYAGRWDVLIQMATKCLNSMFAIGSKLRRNFILDQTNVYPTAQRRKMKNFDGFKRIAVVVVPAEVEYKRRCDKRDREEGKEIPDSAVLEMKANFKLPEVSDIFEDVIFTELERNGAEKLVKQYNEEGKAAMGPARKRFRPNEPQLDNERFDNRKGNLNFNSRKDGMRENFRTFQGDQVMSGPNVYGGNRGDYGSFNNHGRFNGRRGSHGGYGSNFGGRDRGSYVDNYVEKREEYDGNYTGGYEDYGNSGRTGFEDNRGGYTDTYGGGRAGYGRGHRGGRSGHDVNRGRGRGFDGGHRGGYDSNRGNSQGSYDSYGDYDGGGRSGHDVNRGRGRGFDRGHRGGYDSNRGNSQGSYDSYGDYDGGGRSGHDVNRGRGRGFDGGHRGGYDSNRGNSHGSYDSYGDYDGGGRSGHDVNRGRGRGFDGGHRGGYDSNRGNNQGSYDSYGDYDGRDRYDSRGGSYSAYGTPAKESTGNISGYVGDRNYSKSNHLEHGGETLRGDYNASENIPGGSRRNYGFVESGRDNYATEKFSDQGYRNNSSNVFKRGASNDRFQSDNRGAASRYESQRSFNSDMYSKNRDYDTEESYSRDYSYGSGYGEHKVQSSTDSYSTRNVQSSYASGINAKNNPQRFAGSNLGTENKYSEGTGYSRSETRTRWSADTSPTVSSGNAYSTGRPDFPKSAMSSQPKETYRYQEGVTDQPASQAWMPSSASSNPAGYGSAQSNWMQYGQQVPNQYYSQ